MRKGMVSVICLHIAILCFSGMVFSASASQLAVAIIQKDGQQTEYPTLQKAIDSALPGDTVVVPKGVWRETVRIRKTPSHTEPITIRGLDRDECVIDGSSVLDMGSTAWKIETLGGKQVNSMQYDFKGSSLAAWREDGVRVWTYGDKVEFVENTSGNILPGVYYDINKKGKLFVRGIDSTNDSLIVSKEDYTLLIDESSNIRIENLTIRNGGTASLRIAASTDITVSNVTVKGGRHGIYIKDGAKKASSRIRINACRVTEMYDPMWYWSDFKAGKAPMEGAGIYIVSSGSDNEISECEVEGFFDGIAVAATEEWANKNLMLRNNDVHRIMDDAIEVDAVCPNCRIFANVVYDAFVGLSLAPAQGPIYVYRNVILADRKVHFRRSNNLDQYGVAIKIGGTESIPSRNVMIYNNTLIAAIHVISAGYQQRIVKDFTYLNNIFYAHNGYAISTSGNPIDGVFFDSNINFRQKPGPLLAGWRTTSKEPKLSTLADAKVLQSLAEIQWELHGIEADPMIREARTHPPKPIPLLGSPAINAGTDIRQRGWPDSIDVKDGRYDIGALEMD